MRVFLAVPTALVTKVLIEELWFLRLEEDSGVLISDAHDKRTGAERQPLGYLSADSI